MTTVMLIVAAIAHGAILMVWVFRHIRLSRARSDELQPTTPPADWNERPKVTIIVPAHNEEEDLPRCLESILATDYPNLAVILVDDRSTDRTFEIAQSFAVRDSRLRVHRIETADEADAGKVNALRVGSRLADGEWLLFLDADVELIPETISSAVYTAVQRGVEMVSLWPALENRGFAEKLLNPICAGVLQIWCPYEKVSDPDHPAAFATGQFILVRRAAYEAVGGHPRGAWMEDVALARRLKDCGHRIWMGVGERRNRVRMYSGFKATVRGWSRILVGSLEPPWKLPVSLVGAMVGSLLPMVLIVWLGLGRLLNWGVPDTPWTLLFFSTAVVHLGMVIAANWRLASLAGSDKWPLWFYPLAVAGVIWILLVCCHLRFFGGAIQWGGRRYKPSNAGA